MRDWWRRAVFYEIYVRSFQDSDGDGVGDLNGIAQRLDYLNDGTPRSLGVDALWLTPINPSPMHDFGYDVSDYTAVDPLFGSLGDLDRLIAEAHRRDLRVILDLVPNHTSHEHACSGIRAPARRAQARLVHLARPGARRRTAEQLGGQLRRTGVDARSRHRAVLSALVSRRAARPQLPQPGGGARHRGGHPLLAGARVDGFRVDVIHKMIKDAELRDNPPPDETDVHPVRDYFGQQHIYDHDRPEVHDVIRAWRRILDDAGDRMMVGEVYLLDPTKVVPYYGAALDELQLAFNFSFLWTPWDATAFRARVDEMEGLLPPGAQPTYVLSSHDSPRHRSKFDDPVSGDARARLAALMLLTLRGTPFLYYGEEIGMRDGDIPPERVCDPVGKRFPGLGRDPERTPMHWDGGANAGFSPADPWLPMAAEAATVNVAAQIDDPSSLLSFYRRLIWYRKTAPALIDGSYRALESPPDTFVYLREHAEQTLLIALNFADTPRAVTLPRRGALVVSTDSQQAAMSGDRIELRPCEGVVIA